MLLSFAIKDFKEDREFRNISKVTLTNYMTEMREFYNYCVEQELIDTADISNRTIKNYLVMCQKVRNNNPTTINSKLRTLKIFFNYLEEIEIYQTNNNPTRKINYVKADTKIEVFTDEQIKQMLTYYRRLKTRDKGFYAYRNSAMIVTLLSTGMRPGELVNIKWSDVNFESGIITVFGKLHTQTSLPMVNKLGVELNAYKIMCKREFKELPNYVFVTRAGKKMTVQALISIFKRLKKNMGFQNVRCCAYDFRHTFAHRFLMNGGDIYTLQKLMRHSTIDMVQRYLAIWGTALKEQNEKYNPINKMDYL